VTDPHKSPSQRAKQAGLRAVLALVELTAHFVVLAGFLVGIKLLELLVHGLWGADDYVFLRFFKLKYIFDGADLVTLVAFLGWGVYLVVGSYVREPKS
jgi:hypothetical protein